MRILVTYSTGSLSAAFAWLITLGLRDAGIIPLIGSTLSAGSGLYERLVFGGIWGAAGTLVNLYRLSPWQAGLLLSLFPTLAQYLYFLPEAGFGWFGMERSLEFIASIAAVNLLWGLLAALFASTIQR